MSFCLLATLASCRHGPAFAGDWRELRRGEQDGKWGYVDHSGKFVIEPRFENLSNFSEGLASVLPKRGGYGYIDKTGAWAIKPQFNHAWEFSEGLAAVEDRTDKWGYVDTAGHVVIPFQFDSAHSFSEGIAAVEVGGAYKGNWGYIDKTGKFLIEPRFRHSSGFLYGKSKFSEGIAIVEVDGSFELIDRSGGVIAKIEAAYEVHPFHDGRALARFPHDERCQSEVFRYLDRTGSFAFPATFCVAKDFSDGLAAAYQDGKYGYIDSRGNFAIPPRFDMAEEFSEGLAAVKLDSRATSWSFIDKTGHTVIDAIGDGRAEKFAGGLAALDLDSRGGYWARGAKWGYIDKTGRVVCVFTKAKSVKF